MSSFDLKLFAIIFMIIDHIGFVFFPTNISFRIIGRLAFPLFAFQAGIGFKHTKNQKKHILLMLLFGIASQIPFLLMCNIHMKVSSLNVLFTFIFAFLIIYCNENIRNLLIKLTLTLFLLTLTFYIETDYSTFGVLLTILFYYFSSNKLLTSLTLIISVIIKCYLDNSLFGLPAILALLPILAFNKQKGIRAKWLFYIFYPLHMLLLFVVFKFCY